MGLSGSCLVEVVLILDESILWHKDGFSQSLRWAIIIFFFPCKEENLSSVIAMCKVHHGLANMVPRNEQIGGLL